jgi:NAD(P)-dependent dehydrogenase (short-subunit alcohol dehydrogenase family)
MVGYLRVLGIKKMKKLRINHALKANLHFFDQEDFIFQKSLQDKVILVTGASKGIGNVVAKNYAKAGATVILLGRNISELTKLYDEIEEAHFPKPAMYPFNLATAASSDFEDLAMNIDQHFGKLDGLLLNAAELGILTPIEHYPIDLWQQVLQVNLTSNFLLCRSLIPLLKQSSSASIIFTSANMKPKPKAFWGAYAVSKCGVDALKNILSEELATTSSIRVNSINPQAVKTTLRRKAYPAEDAHNLPLPEDIMSTYLYLMSEDSRDVTGQRFEIANF